MDNTPAFHPLDYVSVLQRRKWWLITPVVLAVVVGVALALFLPRKYTSTTTLGISLPTMTGQVVPEGQRLTWQERTRSLNQVLLSPPVLERVAKEEGLDKTMPLADAIDMIAAETQVRLPAFDPTLPPGSVEQFYIDFTHRQPDVAQRVAARLSDVFVEEASMKRTLRTEQTAMFLHEQLQTSQTQLRDLEARRREAREAHMGALPEQTQSNLAMVQALQQQLTSTSNEYSSVQDQLALIERDISSSKPTLDPDPSTPGAPGPTTAGVRVATLEREYALARNQYTDKHPTIIRLKAELDAAKAAAKEEASKPEEQRIAALRADPAYKNLLDEKELAKLRLSALNREMDSIRQRIANYTTRVESAPRVEQQVASLDRDYELEKQHYASLSQQLHQAEINEGVERSQGGERFTIIARAFYPTEPSSPQVARILVITILLGVCLGGALAIGREYLDRSIYDSRALNDLELPVLGEIPRISQV